MGSSISSKTSDLLSEIRLLWDGHGLNRPGSGIHRHAYSMYPFLNRMGLRPRILDLGTDSHGPFYKKIFGSKVFSPNLSGRKLKSLDREDSRIIFHGLANCNLPRGGWFFSRFSSVLTIHDVIPLLAPNLVSKVSRFQVKYCLDSILPRVEKVICVSEWTRRTLCRLYPEVEEKAWVIPNGIEPLDHRGPLIDDGKIKVLSILRYEHYKNFGSLKSVVDKGSDDLSMDVVTDTKGLKWFKEKYPEGLENGRLKVHVGLSDHELTRLINQATVYMSPSMFEGFCLPVAEALSRGVPVVYCSGSGIDEVVSPEVGFPLSPGSCGNDWLECIDLAHKMNWDQSFLMRVEEHLSSKASWEEVTSLLADLYVKLMR